MSMSIWGPPRPRSYMERLKEEQELRQKENNDNKNSGRDQKDEQRKDSDKVN